MRVRARVVTAATNEEAPHARGFFLQPSRGDYFAATTLTISRHLFE